MEKYYLTTPLYYVNSRPHIGHSYTNIAADTLARFQRLTGHEVLFLTGTDEHGQKIDKAAKEAGLTPKDFTDKISETFKDLWTILNISYDDYIRTTEPRHIQAVQAVWKKLFAAGEIYKASYSGWYCTPDETFWTEGQVLNENGQKLCPDCRRPVEHLEEENYFFKISKYQSWLIETVKAGKEMTILPESRRNEVLGFLENNVLQDLCVSRPKNRLAWGIPLPAEISAEHVTYVWFDALVNYVSAVGYGADPKKLAKWWPVDVHIIGKDILRHHAVYWTILLKALDLPLPKMIFAHGWWVQGGEKMSKSRGNAVDPVEIVKTYGVDAYRYFLLRETPFGSDGTFSEEALILRFNTDLANDLGNLLNRSLTMCEKYFEGKVPEIDVVWPRTEEDDAGISNSVSEGYKDIKILVNSMYLQLEQSMGVLAFNSALETIWQLVVRTNRYIEEAAPWKLSKEGKVKDLQVTIKALMESLAAISQAVWPFMPEKAQAIWEQLGLPGKPCDSPFKQNMWGFFKDGGKIAKGAPLFPRIEVKK